MKLNRITSHERRSAAFVGYLAPQPDGSWAGILHDINGAELLLKGEVDTIGERKRISLIASHGPSPDTARLRRESAR